MSKLDYLLAKPIEFNALLLLEDRTIINFKIISSKGIITYNGYIFLKPNTKYKIAYDSKCEDSKIKYKIINFFDKKEVSIINNEYDDIITTLDSNKNNNIIVIETNALVYDDLTLNNLIIEEIDDKE